MTPRPDPLDGVLLHIEPRRTGTLVTRYWPAAPDRGVSASHRLLALADARDAAARLDRRACMDAISRAEEWRP